MYIIPSFGVEYFTGKGKKYANAAVCFVDGLVSAPRPSSVIGQDEGLIIYGFVRLYQLGSIHLYI